MNSKLIIIRGNSGSGKTTIAKALQNQLGSGAMLVSQDVVRRDILNVSDEPGNPAIQLIYDLCMFGDSLGMTVILEGILPKAKYGEMLIKLLQDFSGQAAVYYLDVPFDETVKRHALRPEAEEFNEVKMKQWWRDKDYLGIEGERLIDGAIELTQITESIYDQMQTRSKAKQ